LGLAPWAQTRSFEQPFSLGTNVIGVLPGSDPNLAQEIVILSAHYDHLGKTSKGLCLGACDNASGVAVLLEIAEHLALTENRPKRSICFAAFDCEEMGLLGAFSFSCRDDFTSSQVAAVVNVDGLGRAGFDVLDKHLFLVGSAPYPGLRKQIQKAASGHIQIIPIGTDVIGPRADHVPFEFMGFPALFFSGGPYPDYHLPLDTPDKLDFGLVQACADVIQGTVKLLANADCRYAPNHTDSPDIEELQGLDAVISCIVKHPDATELLSENVHLLEKVQTKMSTYLTDPNSYTSKKRKMLAYWMSEIVLDYEMKVREIKKPLSSFMKETMRPQRVFDMENRESLVDAGRKAVQHINKYRPGLLRGIPTLSLETSVLPDDHLVVTDLGDGRSQLVYCLLKGRMRLQWSNLGKQLRKKLADLKSRFARAILGKPRLITNLFRPSPVMIRVGCHWADITGTPDEIVDTILLASRPSKQYGDRILIIDQHEGVFTRASVNAKFNGWTEAHSEILANVTNNHELETREEWMQWRYKQGAWKTEQDWIADRLKSSHPDVVYQAIQGTPVEQRPILWCEILKDRQQLPWLRWRALVHMHTADSMTLQALTDILDDQTTFQGKDKALPDNHPLKALARFCRNTDRRKPQTEDTKTTPARRLGDSALKRLKHLTKQDFGKDKAAWTKWVEGQGPAE